MIEVKFLGLNATQVQTNLKGKTVLHALSVPLLSQMSNQGLEYRYLVQEEDDLALRKLEGLYKSINEKSQRKSFKIKKIQKQNNDVSVQKGMAWHNIAVGDDGIDTLSERLESISKNGILASEWFGQGYDANEVPYCVSFHKVLKDSQVKNLQEWSNGLNSFSKCGGISLFIDFKNPLLKSLVDVVPAQIKLKTEEEFNRLDNIDIIKALEHVSGYPAVIEERDLKKAKRKAYLDWEKADLFPDDVSDFKKIAKDTHPFSLQAAPERRKFIMSKYESSEKYIELREKFIIKRDKELREKSGPWLYDCYVACGVSAEFINGIALPKSLENNEEFISKLQKLFPSATVFNKKGQLLDKTQNYGVEMN